MNRVTFLIDRFHHKTSSVNYWGTGTIIICIKRLPKCKYANQHHLGLPDEICADLCTFTEQACEHSVKPGLFLSLHKSENIVMSHKKEIQSCHT